MRQAEPGPLNVPVSKRLYEVTTVQSKYVFSSNVGVEVSHFDLSKVEDFGLLKL
jgi:hypothetical protein